MDTYNQSPGSDQQRARSGRGGAHWYVGAAAALLAAGIFGGVALAGNGSAPASQAIPAAATGSASPAGPPDQTGAPGQAGTANPAGPAGPTGQAAVLSVVLSSAGASSAATSTAGVPAPVARRCGRAIRRLRAVGRHHPARVVRRHCRRAVRRRIGLRLLGGMYGQFTFRTAAATRHPAQQAFGARLRFEQKVREFAADASHELRTPLTTIRGYAELYRQGALGPDQLPSAMRGIEQEAQRMSTLVAELLELARLDRTSSLDLTETDLAGVVRDAVADAIAVQPGRPVGLSVRRGRTRRRLGRPRQPDLPARL
jgi:signal transduction histidine kinase